MAANIRVIDRERNEHVITWKAGQSLMEALRDSNLPILASCGGCCSCATCHVFLGPEFVSSIGVSDGDEREMLEMAEAFRPEVSRLSCQITFSEDYDGFVVTLAPEE